MDPVATGMFALVIGAYGYTFAVTRGMASKEDIKDLRERVNMLLEHQLNRKISEKEVKDRMNGKEKK